MVDAQAIASRLISDLMRDYGITRDQAAGVAGNFAHETMGFTRMEETGSGSGLGYGMWTGARRTAFENYAREHELGTDSYAANYGYLKHELDTDRYERRQFMRVTSATTPEEAARIVSENFLRPGTPHMERRVEYATQFASSAPAGPRQAPVPATQSIDMSMSRNPSISIEARRAQITPELPRPRPPHVSDNEALNAIDAAVPGRPVTPSVFGYAPPSATITSLPATASPRTVPSSQIVQSVQAAQSARPTPSRISSIGDSLAMDPVQGGRQTPPPLDAAFDTRTEAMRMLVQPEAVSSQGLGVGTSRAPVAMPRPRPQTAPPDLISQSVQRIASANPTQLPPVLPSTMGQIPQPQIDRGSSRSTAAAPVSRPRVTVSTRFTVPQSHIDRGAPRTVAQSPIGQPPATRIVTSVPVPSSRPSAPAISASSNLASARDEQRLVRSTGTPVVTRVAQTVPSAAGSIIENKPQDRLLPDVANNSPANMGALVGYAAVPTPHATLSRPKAPTVPGTAPIQTANAAPVPAVRSTAVGTQLDVARPVMPPMPRQRPDLGMGGVDIIPVVPDATSVAPMPRLDRPGIFGKPQLFGRDIQLPGALGVIQDITKRMADASGPFNNGADNALYGLMRGGDHNTPGAAVAQSGGFRYAPDPNGGRPINVGRVDPRISSAQNYANRTTNWGQNDDAGDRVNGRGGSSGARSISG